MKFQKLPSTLACAKFYDLSLETESNRDNVGCFLNSRGGFDCPVSGGELVIDFKDFKHMVSLMYSTCLVVFNASRNCRPLLVLTMMAKRIGNVEDH